MIHQYILSDLDERVLACSYGNYPWDEWKQKAVAAGVEEDLAGLGRAVMREAYQHAWDDKLKSLCGWNDDGGRMIKLALRSPDKAQRRWERLLRTDGLRGDCHPATGQWTWGYINPRPQPEKEAS